MTHEAFARRVLFMMLAAGGVLIGVLRIHAQYGPVDVQNVPVDRVIANLESVVAQNSKSVEARNNLARAHAMAYAQKAPTLPVGFGVPGPVWFGYEPENVPFARSVAGAKDEEVMRVARAHLAKALQVYREAMELAPDNYAIKLGYGWCLEQSGEKAQAITVYRAVIATAWRTEKDMRSLGLGRPLTSEAAGYLISLLDPERDRDEIVTLRERMAQIARQPRAITPVAVPLTSDVRSESLIDASVRVTFDADGSGLPKSWTWISPKAGWLVWKPSREQRVTSALQMFGNVTFWLFWKNGYEAMRALDDNHDGQLAGAELDGLAIWQDRNSNGVDDEGEVQPLYVWGIAALSCGYDSTPLSTDYAAMSANGVTFTDGRTRPTYDILLYERPERTAISGLKP